jgi:hypothetical protein
MSSWMLIDDSQSHSESLLLVVSDSTEPSGFFKAETKFKQAITESDPRKIAIQLMDMGKIIPGSGYESIGFWGQYLTKIGPPFFRPSAYINRMLASPE